MAFLSLALAAGAADALLGQWSFREGAGTLAFDDSGNDTAGQLGSGVSRRQGPFGEALSLNGTPQAVVNMPLPAAHQPRRDSFTIQLWCAPRNFAIDSQHQTRRLAGYHDYPAWFFYLDIRDEGRVAFHMAHQGEDGRRVGSSASAPAPIPLNAWTHVVAVCDRETHQIRLFLDGRQVAEAALPAGFDRDLNTRLPFHIGSNWQSTDGLIGEVSFHRGALDAAAVQTAFEADRERYAEPVTEPRQVLRPEGQPMQFHVAPNGNDAWSGTLPQANADRTDGPFQTLGHAASVLQPGDALWLGDGIYREVLRPNLSGTDEAPITIRNLPDQNPLISGLAPLTDWREEGDGIWSAPMLWSLGHMNQLFADGEMLTEARWPNNTGTLFQPTRAKAAAGSFDTLTDPALPGGQDFWKGALLWCAGGASWHCWAREVTGYDDATHTLTFTPAFPQDDRWYRPRAGNHYVLMGVRAALDAPGEWWFDQEARRVLLIPPDGRDPNTMLVEAKQRATVIDLADRSHIRLIGFAFRGGGLNTNSNSTDLLLQNLTGDYFGHSYRHNISGAGSVAISGQRIDVVGCEFSFSSGTVLNVGGSDNRVVNCHVHHGNYGGSWAGCVRVAGRRQVVSRNTFRHAGRDLVSVSGLGESIIERNILSHAGWLTHDLGMTYGHTTDFLNTVFRYNLVHDNVSERTSMGIYFDHLSMNVIVHHNVIWGTLLDPVRFNNPSYFCLAFHNSAWQTGNTGTFDHSRRNDLYGTRFYNNLLTGQTRLPAHVFLAGNLVGGDPGYRDSEARDFRLRDDAPAIGAGIPLAGINQGPNPDAGAIPHGRDLWTVGHDVENPPELPVWEPVSVAYMNLIFNSCFEYGLERWTENGQAKTVAGSGWGNNWGSGEPDPTGTCRGELELGPGQAGVEQIVEGLFPNTCYTLSGWLMAVDEGERVELAVSDFGGETVAAGTDSKIWTRLTVEFKTGPNATSARIQVRKPTPGAGRVRADNLGLQNVPAGSDWERPPEPEPLREVQRLPVPPPFTVRRVERAPRIDGRIEADEWPAETISLLHSPSRERQASPGTARLAHDGQTLYVAVTIPLRNPDALKIGNEWRTHDGVEVCLVDPQGAAPTFSYVSQGFAGGAQQAVTDGGADETATRRFGEAIRYAATVGENSWTGEWAIPFAAADITPTSGLRLPFNLCAYRSESNQWMLWVGTMGAAWRLPEAGTIVLE